MRTIHVLCILLMVAACESSLIRTQEPLKPVAETVSGTTISASHNPKLSWEKDHPERAIWSTELYNELTYNYQTLLKASDWNRFCPRFKALSSPQRLQAMAEVIVWTAYYECNWNPSDSSVDVGTVGDRNTYSVGLLQLSAVDQDTYHLKFGFNFYDLKEPGKNLRMGLAILSKQVLRHGKILIPHGETGLYWATLHPGGKYDKSLSIENHVKQLEFCQ